MSVANRLGDFSSSGDWLALLQTLAAALENLRLSQIEPEECAALHSEVLAWANGFSADNPFHLLRVLATLSRGRRLAATYSDRINELFLLAPRNWAGPWV